MNGTVVQTLTSETNPAIKIRVTEGENPSSSIEDTLDGQAWMSSPETDKVTFEITPEKPLLLSEISITTTNYVKDVTFNLRVEEFPDPLSVVEYFVYIHWATHNNNFTCFDLTLSK